jgi:hypothetical protein
MSFTDFSSPDEVRKAYSITYAEEEFHSAEFVPKFIFNAC